MKIEILILGATIFFIVNTYYDGKYTKLLLSWKKYYKMIFIGVLGIGFYMIVRKNPLQSRKILLHANNMVKYMPFDRSSIDMFKPIIDLTSGGGSSFMESYENHFLPGTGNGTGVQEDSSSKKTATKRSVSETKKKFVAYKQNWMCGECGEKLTHTYEIDHKTRLEYGGSNDVSNLVALCRNCHGNKTAMENM